MNFKRKKSKRQVRCTLCTQHRWYGNHKERKPVRDRKMNQRKFYEERGT